MVLLGPPLRAALALRAAGALRLAISPPHRITAKSPADAALAPLLEPLLAAGRTADARRRDRRSRRVARRARRSDARHLRLRGDAARAADRRRATRRASAARRAIDTPRATSTSCRRSWTRSARRAGRLRRPRPARLRQGAADAAVTTYFEALSGALNRGWAPLARRDRRPREVHRSADPGALRPARIRGGDNLAAFASGRCARAAYAPQAFPPRRRPARPRRRRMHRAPARAGYVCWRPPPTRRPTPRPTIPSG